MPSRRTFPVGVIRHLVDEDDGTRDHVTVARTLIRMR